MWRSAREIPLAQEKSEELVERWSYKQGMVCFRIDLWWNSEYFYRKNEIAKGCFHYLLYIQQFISLSLLIRGGKGSLVVHKDNFISLVFIRRNSSVIIADIEIPDNRRSPPMVSNNPR